MARCSSRRGVAGDFTALVVAVLFVVGLLYGIWADRSGPEGAVTALGGSEGTGHRLCLPSDASDEASKRSARNLRWAEYGRGRAEDPHLYGWETVFQSSGTQYAKIYVGKDGFEVRNAFDILAPGRVVLTGRVPRDCDLSLALALDPKLWGEGASVVFGASVQGEGRSGDVVFERAISADESQSGWLEIQVPLKEVEGQDLEVTLSAEPQNGASQRGCFASLPMFCPRSRSTSKPNVIIYLVDALRADHLGCYGYGPATSPRLDGFAQDSVLFTTASSTSSWTAPGVATIFTGLEPEVHQVLWDCSSLQDRFTTLAEILRGNGWTTWQMTTHPIPRDAQKNLVQGFDGARWLPWFDLTRKSTAADLNEHIFPWLEEHKSEPFFLYVHTVDAHDPYRAPKEYVDFFDPGYTGKTNGERPHNSPDSFWWSKTDRDRQHARAIYDGCVRFNDEHFGKLVDELKRLGLYDDTMIIFTADHGEELWDHPGEAEITSGWSHGRTLYEEVIHIPLVVKFPESEYRGLRHSAPVTHIDFLPTICDVAGVGVPQDSPGRSMVGLLEDEDSWTPRRIYHYLDTYMYSPPTQYLHKIYCVRDGMYKYILRVAPYQQEMLYDLSEDPAERHNIIDSVPEVASKLRLDVRERYLQEGFYVRLAVPTREGVKVEGEIRTDGEFYDVGSLTLEPDDLLQVSTDGRAIRFSMSEEYYDDTVFFRVDPSDAKILFVPRITGEGCPRRALFGSWELDPGPLRGEIRADAEEFSGFPVRTPSLLYALKPQLYLYRLDVGGTARKDASEGEVPLFDDVMMSDDVKAKLEQLKALGYVR